MTQLFKRSAALIVGKDKINGKRWSGLRISFEIEKSSESTPNPGKVSIYNLSKASRAELEGKGLIMILEVGYLGLDPVAVVGPPKKPVLAQLFVGDVKRVTTVRQGPDIVTTLEAGDAERVIREKHIDMSFSEFTSAQQVIQAIAAKLGVGIGTIVPAALQVFQNGLSLTGLASDNMDTITKKLGLEWSITDGQLNVLTPNKPTAAPAVLLTDETGLVGMPSKGKQEADVHIEFQSLLNTEIYPGRAVDLVSEAISGIFRVRKARYRGDTHAGDWLVACEAIQ